MKWLMHRCGYRQYYTEYLDGEDGPTIWAKSHYDARMQLRDKYSEPLKIVGTIKPNKQP